jgi:hydrogenase maturation factor
MKLYQLHRTHDAGESVGYEYFTARRGAERALATWRRNSPGDVQDQQGSIAIVMVDPTKVGICAALNRYAAHADNG